MNQHHIESECRRYTVSRAASAGRLVYTAWRRPGIEEKARARRQGAEAHARSLGYRDNAADCRALCEADTQTQSTTE